MALATLAIVSTVDDLRFSAEDPWKVAVLLTGCAAVTLAGIRPLLALVLTWVMLVLGWQAGSVTALLLPLWLTTAVVHAIVERRIGMIHAVTAIVALTALVISHTTFSVTAGFWGCTMLIFTAVALGEILRWALEAREQSHRAEETRRQEAVEHEQRLARARDDERSALARALHDVVASQLTIIATTVAAARTSSQPQALHDALDVVDSSTQTALVEMRELLQVLDRAETRGDSARPATRVTDPPSARISHLARTLTRLGREVTMDLDTHALDTVNAATADAAVRVVRESLTNAVRYAGDGPTSVSVQAVDRWLEVRLRTPQIGQQAPDRLRSMGSGRGLEGLATTVNEVGGSLRAGPDHSHWLVEAQLPLSR